MDVNIKQGDSLELLKTLEDNSVDSVITDPPYELSFMGKSWDSTGIANNVELWKQCLRVLKPGGHLLAFSGTRTYHRMACAIEDAGFEVRDMIEWVYSTGFPKSLNIGKSVNQLETNEWSKIGKALDNIDQKSIMEVWKSNSNNVKIVETQSLKNQIIVGQDTPSENFVVLNVAQNSSQENSNLLVSFVEQNLNEVQAINTKTNTALPSVEVEIRQLQDNVNFAEKQLQNQNHKSWNIFTAQCDVKEWLNENTEVNHKVDEALKTLRGNKKYSNEEITSVLCVALTDILKLTILNQSKTFQNLGTKSKMDYASVINVIITEYTAENLISNTVAILKGKAVDKLQGNEREVVGERRQRANSENSNIRMNASAGDVEIVTKGTSEWEGWGTALKPAHEPICMARKPLSEKTVAENCLKWGTGGINIDESRVETDDDLSKRYDSSFQEGNSQFVSETATHSGKRMEIKAPEATALGRFPANLIHDNSEEVRECFPETGKSAGLKCKAGKNKGLGNSLNSFKNHTDQYGGFDDSGNASRFFKSIIYQAKASKKERNAGCEGLEEKEGIRTNAPRENEDIKTPTRTNKHPTVKPIALMEYLIKMVTPKDGTVLDPFMGSGSTGVACVENGYSFIGFDLTPEYVEIAKARIENAEKQFYKKLF